jgi:hypothetical protein
MSPVWTILIVWVLVVLVCTMFASHLGYAAKRGDEVLWRARLTRLLADRGRRIDERRTVDRRRAVGLRGVRLERRQGERRRRSDRRADPGWRDAADI